MKEGFYLGIGIALGVPIAVWILLLAEHVYYFVELKIEDAKKKRYYKKEKEKRAK